jgi:hypothetical protein
MRKLAVALSLSLTAVLAIPQLTRPGTALTSAKAVDRTNAFPSVGAIMVWRDPNNPLGLPGGLAGQVTGVLIHSQTILTAGHFAARAEQIGRASWRERGAKQVSLWVGAVGRKRDM